MDPALALEVSALSGMRAIAEAEARGDSTVQRAYRHAVAFVTGASGFLGKHFMEKLLRSTDIDKVYLLLRSKKGKSAEERLVNILSDPLYDSLRKTKTEFHLKLAVVEGDITQLGLGLSQEDREVLSREVNFIFHVAATTRFDEPLQVATITNVRGTREMLALAKSCRNLRSFVYVSTAYSFATRSRIRADVLEELYDVPIPPHELIEMAELKEDKRLKEATAILLQEWPNTYCATKAAAEHVVRASSEDLPVSVVRPPVVLNAYREPVPGWLDINAIFGPVGIILATCLGLVRTVIVDTTVKLNAVPADLVNNATLAAGWVTAASPEFKIYTVTSHRNPTTWGDGTKVLTATVRKICSPKAVWYPYCINTDNRLLFDLVFWLLHYIPAYIIDGICVLTGKKQQFVKLYKKAYNLITVNIYFTTNEWKCSDKNLQILLKDMSEMDKKIYNFDVCTIDWEEFHKLIFMGLRKYIIKDGLTGTDYGLKKQFWFRIANVIVLTLYAYLWWKLFTFIFNFSGIQYLFL